jgi:hypothetical protein
VAIGITIVSLDFWYSIGASFFFFCQLNSSFIGLALKFACGNRLRGFFQVQRKIEGIAVFWLDTYVCGH